MTYKIWIADFETTPFDILAKNDYELKSRFVCFLEIYSQERIFMNLESEGSKKLIEFLRSISNVKNPSRVYFHNLRFDLAFLFELLQKDCNYKLIKSGSKIINFQVYRQYEIFDKKLNRYRLQKKTILDLRDSYALLPTSVKFIGQSVNLEKLEQDYNVKEIDDKYIEYCFRDCEIIERALRELVVYYRKHYRYETSILDLPITLPSQSKRVWLKRLVNQNGKQILNKIFDQNRLDYMERMRKFYCGGKVEVYDFNVCENGHYNDANSFYALPMYILDFPLAPYFEIDNMDDKDWNFLKENKKIFGCECVVYENSNFPLIPYKEENKKVFFPNGKKEWFCFRFELDYLIENNQKVEIKKIWMCSDYFPVFRDYISITYDLKKNGKTKFDIGFSKLSLVSLYGKLAEKLEKDLIEIINDFIHLESKEFEKIEMLEQKDGSFISIKRDKEYNPKLKVNIFFSMMITAFCRLELTKNCIKASKLGSCHYDDSDSIVSSNLFENSKELGKFKSEFQFHKFQALGCKEYIYHFTEMQQQVLLRLPVNMLNIKMKGFGKIKVNNFKDFITEYYEGKKQMRLIGLLESFKRNKSMRTILVYDKYKTHCYDKRVILDDLTTRPIDLNKDDFEKVKENNFKLINRIIEKYS